MIFDRRKFIRNSSLLLSSFGFSQTFAKSLKFKNSFSLPKPAVFGFDFKKSKDRVWLSEDLWSIPLEDWQLKSGRIIGESSIDNARINLLTHQIKKGDGAFMLTYKIGVLKYDSTNTSVGVTLGINDETDTQSTSAAVYFGKGVRIGVNLKGEIFIENERKILEPNFNFSDFEITITGKTNEDKTELNISITDKIGNTASLNKTIESDISGLVSLNLFDKSTTAWLDKIELSGTKIVEKKEETFGPIFWCMYTLSDQTLKLTAQLPPLSIPERKTLDLEIKKDNIWLKTSTTSLDPIACTAVFKIENWKEEQNLPYRVTYNLDDKTHTFEGLIRAEPKSQKIKLGALTCQHAMAFPYRPLVENLIKTNPDILYFSGDQIYEENGGYPIKRAPEDKAILSYLGKYYMFGWAFKNVMKDRPTICTPDDHDVFQGNLWGENGKLLSIAEWEAQRDAQGGLVQTALMVNVVNKTQCAHLPDPFHSTLLPSGISTWYTHLRYGGVSFAIVSDRMFKSGPEIIRKGTGRIDHVTERLQPGELEAEALSMMGNPQMQFLKNWIEDWKDSNMKVLLSQTLFANVATHHGPKKEFLYGDLDSGGWPKKQRDEVLRLLQKAAVFHINGDQHLPFIVKYSIDNEQDGAWTFCTPAISTGYPRWAKPDQVNMPYTKRPAHNLENTGLYKDIFGNDNFVYAVGNPENEFDFEKNRYKRAQLKASGFGLISFETNKRTIQMEAIRFLADLSKVDSKNTYPGWPFEINQIDNDGRRALGYLPNIKTSKQNQVIKIYDQANGELISASRISGLEVRPPVFTNSVFKLMIGEEKDAIELKNITITNNPNEEIRI